MTRLRALAVTDELHVPRGNGNIFFLITRSTLWNKTSSSIHPASVYYATHATGVATRCRIRRYAAVLCIGSSPLYFLPCKCTTSARQPDRALSALLKCWPADASAEGILKWPLVSRQNHSKSKAAYRPLGVYFNVRARIDLCFVFSNSSLHGQWGKWNCGATRSGNLLKIN